MKNSVRGFTLIELMVTLSIAAVLLLVAVPSFDNLMEKNRVEAVQKDLARDIAYARQLASTRNTFVSVCKSADGAACTNAGDWDQGWLVFIDTPGGNAGQVEGEEILKVHGAINSNDSMSGTEDFIQFASNGALQVPDAGSPSFKICSASNSHGRGITVLRSGRAIVDPGVACP